MNFVSMSSAIQRLIAMEEGQTLNDYNRVNATKIRRVYDVTNVLCSLNLIRKETVSCFPMFLFLEISLVRVCFRLHGKRHKMLRHTITLTILPPTSSMKTPEESVHQPRVKLQTARIVKSWNGRVFHQR